MDRTVPAGAALSRGLISTKGTAMDKARFYAALRRRSSGVFGTSLSQGQVNALEVILDEASRRDLPLRHLAYVLATPYHEVGSSLRPVRENLNYTAEAIRRTWPSRFPSVVDAQPYARNPRKLANKVYGGRLGNTGPDDGWIYRGGGWPQTTGKDNYRKSSKLVGIDLVADPDRMLEPRIAAVTMIESMMHGLYTGKKLSDFIRDGRVDYVGARAIINADVRKNGAKIAGYARSFEAALRESGYSAASQPGAGPKPSQRPTTPEKPKSPPVKPAGGILAAIIAALAAGAAFITNLPCQWFGILCGG